MDLVMVDVNAKKEKKMYDEDGGLYLMRNWPSVLRWICIIPAVIITLLLSKGMVSFFVSMIEKNFSDTIAIYVDAFLIFIPFLVAIDTAGAVAPKKRTLVSIITAFILGVLAILINIYLYMLALDNNFIFGINNYICMGISFISLIFGLVMGVRMTKDRQNKR